MINLVGEDALPRLEAILANDVHRATEAVGRLVGGRHLRDLDARNVGRGKIEKTVAPARPACRGHLGAVEFDPGLRRGQAADDDVLRELTATFIDADTGQEAEELADIFRTAVAVFVVGDDVDEVRRLAALVERDGLRTHLTIGEHGKRAELDGLIAARERELEVAGHASFSRHRDQRRLWGEADINNRETRGADGEAGEAIDALVVGERILRRALDGDDRTAERDAACGVEDATGDLAGGCLSTEEGADEQQKKDQAKRGIHGE